jgi:hypothetical protein
MFAPLHAKTGMSAAVVVLKHATTAKLADCATQKAVPLNIDQPFMLPMFITLLSANALNVVFAADVTIFGCFVQLALSDVLLTVPVVLIVTIKIEEQM